jgi:hypothetical protein
MSLRDEFLAWTKAEYRNRCGKDYPSRDKDAEMVADVFVPWFEQKLTEARAETVERCIERFREFCALPYVRADCRFSNSCYWYEHRIMTHGCGIGQELERQLAAMEKEGKKEEACHPKN